MNKIDYYIKEVLDNIVAEEKMKNRIESDLVTHLNEASQTENIDDVLSKMGDPKDVAKEFMNTMYEDKSEIIETFIKERTGKNMQFNSFYEYKSGISLFGLPLVHIKFNRFGGKPCLAKGIIAIGNFSVGVVSISSIPLGIISIGGAPIGIFSFGGLAIGLLLAIGGLSIGTMAIGGLAIGLGAIGGFAIGKIAVGGYASGIVAIGREAVGEYALNTNHIGPDISDVVYSFIKSAFPNLPEWIIKIFASLKIGIQK